MITTDIANLWPQEIFSRLRLRKQRAFLAAFCRCGGLSKSAQIAGIVLSNHYNWLHEPEYKAAYAEAQAIAGDYLEEIAWRRAADGVERPVYWQGKVVGYITEYSDGLIKFLLKGAKPTRYRDNIDITSQGHSLNIYIDSPEPLQLTAADIDADAREVDSDDADD